MTADVFRFEFDHKVSLVEAEMSLHMAILAAGGLFGDARVRLDAGYFVDEPRQVIVVDGTTEVGAAVVRVFTSFAIHEFGQDAFTVRRVEACPQPTTHERNVAA